MSKQLNIYFILFLFIFSCSEETSLIINNNISNLPNQNYKINLWSSNSGSTLESVTIFWNTTEGEVKLFVSGEDIYPSGNSHTFSGMSPGEFRDISIQVIAVDSTYVDSIQIFTRPVYPVTNFRYEIETVKRGNLIYDFGEIYTDLGNGVWDEGEYFTDANFDGVWNEGESFTDLGNGEWNEGEEFTDVEYPKYHRIINWSTTAELDDNFTDYILYRVANNNAVDLINSENCACKLVTLTKNDTSFTDSMVTEESGIYSYFYQIRVNAGDSGRNSYIYNYTNFISPGKISLTNSNVSKNNNEFIQITWEPVSNSTYFYQYEIWRSSNENADNSQQIAIIIDPLQKKFMDRNVGNGTTWYYSVAVVDINGQRKYSDYISGWSNP
ncbi:MAG: hypothetical protein H8E85_01630 [Candidatus Marinimicrobia bacterium]|nr:hypothetical protein [Candidatus Neomarinimicrobiota bacterium]